MAYLDDTGLAYFWGKIKAWANSVFALLGHTHPSSDVTAMTGYSMPSSTGAISSGDTLNQAVGKLEKAITAADISNVVHKTGTETITGYKYFENRKVRIKSTDRAIGETYSSDVDTAYRYNTLVFIDRNNEWGGAVELSFRESGLMDFKIFCTDWNNPGNLDDFAYVSIGYDENGVRYTQIPSTSENRTSGNDVLTRDWIPKDSRIVHTTGNEVVAGSKTFSDRVYIQSQQLVAVDFKYTSFSIPSLPSESKYLGYSFSDNSSRVLVECYHRIYSNGDHAKVWSLHDTKSTNAYKQFVYQYIADGDKFYLSGPADFDYSDSSGKIPNTAWLRSATGNFACNAATATKATQDKNGLQIDTGYLKLSGGYMTGNINFEKTATISGVSKTHNANITLNSSSLNFGAWDGTNNKWIWVANVDGTNTFNGNAKTADKLTTSRTIRTNLASTSTASFDGSADITPGVTGTLPVANGGTGLTSLDTFVRTTGDQTIAGEKTFTTSPAINRINPYIYFVETDWEKGTPQSNGATSYQGLQFQEKNGVNGGVIYYNYDQNKNSYVSIYAYNMSTASATGSTELYLGYNADNTQYFRAGGNGTTLLGRSGNRWKEIWCTQSSINSTSDSRLKQAVAGIPDEVLDAWSGVEWVQYKFNDAVAEKGREGARLHTGMIAQDIDAAFRSRGLDVSGYGLFLYDEWEEHSERRDEKGNVVERYEPAGDAYGLRYVEALCMEAAYMRRENARLKERLAALEERLAALEMK